MQSRDCANSQIARNICILPYLCVMQYFHVIHDIAKLATFESQKEVVCTTHGIPRKKERKAIKGIETNATGIVVLLKALNKGRQG